MARQLKFKRGWIRPVGHFDIEAGVFAGDEGLRKKLGEQGRESVKEKFAPETMVDKIEKVYKKLLGGSE